MTYVYFLELATYGRLPGPIKIGVARSIKERIRMLERNELAGSFPELLGFFECSSHAEAMKIETSVRRRFVCNLTYLHRSREILDVPLEDILAFVASVDGSRPFYRVAQSHGRTADNAA